ncbi:MAG: hypothetical protein LBS83_01575 [Holosporales bacterium]|jgi:hypothetical protein|nr:hypothetical protein [Holosporales bacterium]
MNKKVFKNPFLKDRISLIYKESTATSTGTETVTKFSHQVWGTVLPLRKINVRYISFIQGLGKNIADQLYKVIIRTQSCLEKKPNEVQEFFKINAVKWKEKEFDLMFPFSIIDDGGIFSESLCIEKVKKC